MNKKTIGIILVVSVFIFGGAYFLWKESQEPGPLDGFARCLADEGAVFYGTFWCSHCKNQKGLFGRSQKYLPYVECSTRDGQRQLPRCANEGILAYPTWEFRDGTRAEGVITLQDISEKTGCQLP